ncbi:cation-transporting P-type ATPase [Clostridium butyricum]
MNNFFSKTTDECLKELNSSMEGLSKEKCTDLLNSVGENILNEKEKKVYGLYLLSNLKIFWLLY